MDLVRQWKDEGIYPFAGDARNVVELAHREVFDLCAVQVHRHLDAFRQGSLRDRQFTLHMLKTALDENPESLKRILSEVLGLPAASRDALGELLLKTNLPALIAASTLATDRLKILEGLQDLLFQPASRRSVPERPTLHRILERETWIFGEEYLLSHSDENLNTLLRKHLPLLGRDGRHPARTTRVKRDDGREAVPDLILGREIPAYASTRREFLVVELKRPSRKIDLAAKAQLESYALTVVHDERFDKANTHWTFLAISNAITPQADYTLDQTGRPFGVFLNNRQVTIGLATWAQILNAARVRLEAYRDKLDYLATRDEGVALLHRRYAQYLSPPGAMAGCQ